MNKAAAEFSRWEYRNIALAAVTQCAVLVHRLANHGSVPTASLVACLQPTYELDAPSLESLYPDVRLFSEGIETLQRSFDSEGLREHSAVIGYTLSMLTLQQHLRRRDDKQQELRTRLASLQGYAALTEPTGEPDQQAIRDSCQALARLYQDTISKLRFRIHVAGNPEHLRDHVVADQIRALLLAGIRSATLWHQLGGRRWHMVFYKNRCREALAGIRRKLLTH